MRSARKSSWDHRFIAPFGDAGQIVQVLQEFLIITDRQYDRGPVTAFVGEIL